MTMISKSAEFTKPQTPPRLQELAHVPTDVTPLMSENACMDETTNSILSQVIKPCVNNSSERVNDMQIDVSFTTQE